MLKEKQDAFGQLIYAHFKGEEVFEVVEREDGYLEASNIPFLYFADFTDWPEIEREAIQFARGRVLDVGSGAGRVALYLQSKGLEVVAIDNSPLALEVCRQRGVKNTSLTPISQVSRARLGIFDSIVMFGNNFGLFGSYTGARRLLGKFYKITSPEGRIIATTNDIYQTTNPAHLAYQAYNRKRGRMSGQIRLRDRFRQYATPWMDYLMVSQEEMTDILNGTGWQVSRFIERPSISIYAVIIEKVL